MIPHPLTASLRAGLSFVALAAILTGGSGCAHLTTFYNGVLLRAQTKHQLANVRQDTRQALAQQTQEVQRVQAQRDIEQARLDAENRRLEAEFCIANQEQQQRRVKENLRQSVESKVAFNVEQALEVGELEVDTEALKQLLEKKEQEQRQPPTQNQEQRSCPCCDRQCDCGSGFLRRFCPHCRNKPCEAEKNCGGPAQLAQLQQQPQKQPLRPAEIPMKLPVRLTFGFQQPQLEQAQIRRQPPTQEQKVPCDRCPRCDAPRGQCQCAAPGSAAFNGLGPAPSGGAPIDPDAPPSPVYVPPTPVPDAEAYYAPGRMLNALFSPVRPISNQRVVAER